MGSGVNASRNVSKNKMPVAEKEKTSNNLLSWGMAQESSKASTGNFRVRADGTDKFLKVSF